MKISQSKLGWMFSLLYVLVSVYFIYTQGLFGESFITVILGLPWSLLLAFFEYGNVTGGLLYVLALAPIVLNALLLYLIGYFIQGKRAV